MKLIEIADGVWQLDTWIKMVFGLPFPARMTVVRLADGRLWLHSPVPIDDESAKQLEALGDVAYLIAPNLHHHLFAVTAKERYPAAELWACPGLPAKKKKIAFDAELDPSTDAPWAADIDQHLVAGCPGMSEMVFLHRNSKSLIVTDLLMNMHEVRGWRMRLILWLAGTRGKFVQSKFWKPFTKDRHAALGSVRRILSWQPERVLFCHGDPLEANVRDQLRVAFRVWVREPSDLEEPRQLTAG